MASKPLDVSLLKAFSPLDGLKRESLHSVARKATMRELPHGRLLFKEGDADRHTYFLLRGTLELTADGRAVYTIRAGSPEARSPIAPGSPRRLSARVASDRAEVIAIDSEMLDVILTWDQTGSYEVNELQTLEEDLAESDDWMTVLLQTKAFHRIPPANIQAIFLRMQRVDYAPGDVIIRQGDEGDYFYVIAKGKCAVTRETPLNREGIKLAELSVGDSFGEEALISDARRNATITALTDVVAMRLNREDFLQLMNEPLLERIDRQAAEFIVARGGRWLDVRLPSEYDQGHLPNALNVPLYFLRLKLKSLDRNTPYVVYCDTGRRSSAAAYILAERGFQAYVLQGGMAAMNRA
ncbi:MAG TPA: cyclic nucleotide-binding domain-containing protein [Steroidobacteraceae bacterium]